MSAPALPYKLDLEEVQRTPDGSGGYDQSWVRLGTLWGAIRAGSGRERADPLHPQSVQNLIVTVRAAEPGTPQRPQSGQRFRTAGRVLLIRAVAEGDKAARFLTCRCIEEGGA
ncbi:MAG: head-tail adaptor protein [Brevirhabdus sp.]